MNEETKKLLLEDQRKVRELSKKLIANPNLKIQIYGEGISRPSEYPGQ